MYFVTVDVIVVSRNWEQYQSRQNPEKRAGKRGSRLLGMPSGPTLRAPLSGTLIQTLPDLVTPLKRHSLSPCCYPPTRSAASESFATNMTVEAA